MSKENFFLMRAEEMATLYDASFTKKEAITTGKRMVDNIIEAGEIGKLEFMSNLARLKWVIDSAESEMRSKLELFDTQIVNGVTFTHVKGGKTLNYTDDEIYNQLKADLDNRVELLKLAQNQTIIDAYGNEVPKVSTKPRASSITITTK